MYIALISDVLMPTHGGDSIAGKQSYRSGFIRQGAAVQLRSRADGFRCAFAESRYSAHGYYKAQARVLLS